MYYEKMSESDVASAKSFLEGFIENHEGKDKEAGIKVLNAFNNDLKCDYIKVI